MRGLRLDSSAASLVAWLEMASVGVAAVIPLGAAAERWRLGASCASTALLAGWTYPVFAHWVRASGWLAELGVNFGLGRGFLDAGGSSTIHAVGGLTGLALAWILGPRRGKYSIDGMPAAMPGHNSILVLTACFFTLVGWLGLNCAGAILFSGIETTLLPLIAINTTLAAAGGALTAAAITRIRFGKPDASLSANGWVGGLVASSAACPFIVPATALLIGLTTGALIVFSVEWLEIHLGVDDAGGAISVHAVGGLWGVVALGLFARVHGPILNVAGAPLPAGAMSDSGQWVAQLVGATTLLGFVLPMTYGLNWVLNRIYPQRAAPDGERLGMDLYELGAGAYPEFVTHTEDFTQR
jgi:Amt family ammonium transporter